MERLPLSYPDLTKQTYIRYANIAKIEQQNIKKLERYHVSPLDGQSYKITGGGGFNQFYSRLTPASAAVHNIWLVFRSSWSISN